MRNTQASNILTLTLTNNTASAYSIDSLNFDFFARSNGTDNGFRGFDVVYTSGGSGDADTSVGLASGLTALNVANTYGYLDYDFTLSDHLTDVVLEAG